MNIEEKAAREGGWESCDCSSLVKLGGGRGGRWVHCNAKVRGELSGVPPSLVSTWLNIALAQREGGRGNVVSGKYFKGGKEEESDIGHTGKRCGVGGIHLR